MNAYLLCCTCVSWRQHKRVWRPLEVQKSVRWNCHQFSKKICLRTSWGTTGSWNFSTSLNVLVPCKICCVYCKPDRRVDFRRPADTEKTSFSRFHRYNNPLPRLKIVMTERIILKLNFYAQISKRTLWSVFVVHIDLLSSFSGTSFDKPDKSWANSWPNGNKSTLFSSTPYFSRVRNTLIFITLGLGNAIPFDCFLNS